MMAITTRPARMLLLSGALLTCACEQQTTTLDDALRAYDAKRYAESLRMSKDIQGNATDPLTRQQAAYPTEWTREQKFWAVVDRIDNAYGDRNLVCACLPMEAYAEKDTTGS